MNFRYSEDEERFRQEVLDFIKLMGLPNNKLYAEGSKRVGCSTCTAYKNWEDEMQRLSPKLYAIIKARMGQTEGQIRLPIGN